ncbi:hypothetical protein [Qipengyuania sp. 483]
MKSYKAANPDAAACRIHAAPIAYVPKPSGYVAELAMTVTQWFDSEAALSQSNKADVARLNGKLGTTFNTGNHFSKPLSPSALKRIADVFADRRATLCPRNVRTMSDVRKAVRAAKAAGSAASVPLGAWGSRDGDSLIVGNAIFAIERHNGNDCIRIPVGGSRIRIRLDALGEFMSATGISLSSGAGSISNHLPRSGIGELAPKPEKRPLATAADSSLPENCPRSAAAPDHLPTGELVPDASQPTLAERIKRLNQPRPVAPVCADAVDPLKLP